MLCRLLTFTTILLISSAAQAIEPNCSAYPAGSVQKYSCEYKAAEKGTQPQAKQKKTRKTARDYNRDTLRAMRETEDLRVALRLEQYKRRARRNDELRALGRTPDTYCDFEGETIVCRTPWYIRATRCTLNWSTEQRNHATIDSRFWFELLNSVFYISIHSSTGKPGV